MVKLQLLPWESSPDTMVGLRIDLSICFILLPGSFLPSLLLPREVLGSPSLEGVQEPWCGMEGCGQGDGGVGLGSPGATAVILATLSPQRCSGGAQPRAECSRCRAMFYAVAKWCLQSWPQNPSVWWQASDVCRCPWFLLQVDTDFIELSLRLFSQVQNWQFWVYF